MESYPLSVPILVEFKFGILILIVVGILMLIVVLIRISRNRRGLSDGGTREARGDLIAIVKGLDRMEERIANLEEIVSYGRRE